jgi:hypothetical protein
MARASLPSKAPRTYEGSTIPKSGSVMSDTSKELLGLSTMVVTAYVRHNRVPQADLVGLLPVSWTPRLGVS